MMSADVAGLLNEIADSPMALDLWLIYADAIDEAGHARRADLIRALCYRGQSRDRPKHDPDDHADLEMKVIELLYDLPDEDWKRMPPLERAFCEGRCHEPAHASIFPGRPSAHLRGPYRGHD